MKALVIGGTGTISTAVVNRLAETGWDVTVLNRGNRNGSIPEGVKHIAADMNEEEDVRAKLEGLSFDTVCEFIGYKKEQVERDFRLFAGKTKQYIYISSASAYHKPLRSHIVNEATALANPYWQYSRDKIECEEFLMRMYREKGFPVTIVRPSHTFDERKLPVAIHGNRGSWQVAERILAGKPVIIPGDGTALWTLTFNTDFAMGYVGLMGNPHAIGEAFQITANESMTWDQIHRVIADALGKELIACHVSSDFLAAAGPQFDLYGGLLGDKAANIVFDNTKLKRAVPQYSPKIRMEEGLRRTVEYILAHPEYQVKDPEFDSWCDKVIEVREEAKARFL